MVERGSPQYNIILVDDYAPLRRLVREIIEGNPDLKVVGELDNGRDLITFLDNFPAQMVVLDISMPVVTGFEAARLVKRDYPEVKVLFLTIHNYREYLDEALGAGAEGYVLKDEVVDELLPAITSVREGGRFVSRRLSA